MNFPIILFRKYFIIFFIFMLVSLFLSSIIFAAPPNEAASPAEAPSFIDALDKSNETKALADNEIMLMRGPPDDFNRGTPRGSIIELRKALKQGDFKTATNFLDYRNLPYSIEEEGGKEGLVKNY